MGSSACSQRPSCQVLAASCLKVLAEDPETLHKLPPVLPQLVARPRPFHPHRQYLQPHHGLSTLTAMPVLPVSD